MEFWFSRRLKSFNVGKLFLTVFLFVSLFHISAGSEYRHWVVGTTAPDIAKYNYTWWDLSGEPDSPGNSIFSGTLNREYFFLGGGNSEFTLYNGSFDRFSQSETPFKNKVQGLASNSTHVYIGTAQPDHFLYDVQNRKFSDLGVQSDQSSVVTAVSSYDASIGGEYFLFGTQQPSVWKWNGSFNDISPGFFDNSIGDSERNSTHILMGDTSGVVGLYDGEGWKDISGRLGFENNNKIFAIGYGDFGGTPFWLIGGTNGRLERFWVNGTSQDLSSDLPGSWKIRSIGYSEDEDRFFIGGASGNVYVYRDNGFFQNQPEFSWQNSVRFIGYNPFPKTASAPSISLQQPSQDFYSSNEVPVSGSVKNFDKIIYNVDGKRNRTANQPRVVFADQNSNLKYLVENGSVIDLGVKASIVGQQAHLDQDNRKETPFIDNSGRLKVIDTKGRSSILETGLSTSKNLIGVGKWKENENYIFYRDSSDNNFIKKVRVGEPPETVLNGIQSKSVLGTGDFNQDGDRDIVFLGTSQEIKWLDGGTVQSTGFSSFGSNNNFGVGHPTDFDGDGEIRVPYVTGSNNLALIDYQNNKFKLNQNYGQASKTSVAGVKWRDIDDKVIFHLDSSTRSLKFMKLDGTDKFVDDINFSRVSATTATGLSEGVQNGLNHTERSVSEGFHTLNVFASNNGNFSFESEVFGVDLSAPEFRSFDDNVSGRFFRPDTANISAQVRDNVSGVDQVILATNETGSLKNKSIYKSPNLFNGVTGVFAQSSFIWRNTSFVGDLRYNLWAEDVAGNYGRTSFDSFRVDDIDLKPLGIEFSESDPVESQRFNIALSVENFGLRSADVQIDLREQVFNGTDFVLEQKKLRNLTLASNSVSNIVFEDKAELGPRRYRFEVDSLDDVNESNESNNNISDILNVPLYGVFFRETVTTVKLSDFRNDTFYRYEENYKSGTIYFVDSDASFSFSSLQPLADFQALKTADNALGSTGFNDSISEVWGENQGLRRTECFFISGSDVCNVPVANSTQNSFFDTGIVYDGGSSYQKSDTLVFVSDLVPSRQGGFGTYDYEIKVPSTLPETEGSSNKLDVYREIE